MIKYLPSIKYVYFFLSAFCIFVVVFNGNNSIDVQLHDTYYVFYASAIFQMLFVFYFIQGVIAYFNSRYRQQGIFHYFQLFFSLIGIAFFSVFFKVGYLKSNVLCNGYCILVLLFAVASVAFGFLLQLYSGLKIILKR